MKEISREDLFALVREKPTVEVAKELGVSDVEVAKLCTRLQVPKPPRGYWTRVETGQTPRRAPLRAFRQELEDRRKTLTRPKPGIIGLTPIRRKFVDHALTELAAKGIDTSEVRIAAVSDTTIHGRHSLRVAICNHRTLATDLDQLRAEIMRIGGILAKPAL